MFVFVQLLSHVRLFVTPWTAAHTGFPVLHYLPECAQTHVHWVCDAIQPSSSVVSFFSCLQSLTASVSLIRVGSLHQVAKVLELQPQYQSFQWIFRVDFPQDWLVWSPCCPRDSQESSPTPQFIQVSLLFIFQGHVNYVPWISQYFLSSLYNIGTKF